MTRVAARVTGVVQGVGFRPFVHRLATASGLAGFVGNDGAGVFVEVEGEPEVVDRFLARLVVDAPPMARVEGLESTVVPPVGEGGFTIVESGAGGAVDTTCAPDAAVCDDCLRELFDPADRRHRYPFVTCTNCGPRFTITRSLPYDRPATTMAGFPLCPACAAEYHDPGDRRFHAQPLACPDCGPHLAFDGVVGDAAALAAAQAALRGGAVVAVKGIGGYHLACLAGDAGAVARLRERKRRPDKPFAVMVADLAAARALADVDGVEAALLTSPARPIVLLRATAVLSGVAPGNPRLGLLLPYSPLHHLLLDGLPGPLVLTSGNLSDEPICFDDDDARRRLGSIADAFLTHDRPIHVPCDDSVVRVLDGAAVVLRRSRGHAPLPVRLPVAGPPLLATGGELKNTFCLARGRDAWLGQHVGDMGSVETLAAFERGIGQLRSLYGVDPEVVATDLHPGYHTTAWAEQSGLPVEAVQHHHAHLASVLAEHGEPVDARVVGIVLDGTGYGCDATIWGGEVLVGGYAEVERVAHLRPVPLPGGDAAVRRPYRVALAHLWAAGLPWDPDLAPVAAAGDEVATLAAQLRSGFGCTPTSSAGRLFDAVASLLGLRQVVTYEAQAAMALEDLATGALDRAGTYAFGAGLDPAPVLAALVDDLRRGRPLDELAAGFHVAVADALAGAAVAAGRAAGTATAALSGGVFQNGVLLGLVRRRLATAGFRVLTHALVPPNDGGLALGQAAVVAVRSGGGR